ncbi:MAG: rhodanese-like domain-containing protein [Sideroxydans sp.]|nr:rhodanese-like domain-containing protein [Sideroxydans sp.]
MNSKIVIGVLIAAVALAFFFLKSQGAEGVDVKQAQLMSQQGALLLDVREPDEYAAVHAVNAKLIPLGEVGARLKEVEAYKDKPVAVICRSGRRSAQAVGILKDAGFTQVVNVQGGTSAWVKAGLETIKQ